MGFFSKMSQKFQGFMYGRYGIDQFNIFLMVLALITSLIPYYIANIVALVLMALELLRMFSKIFMLDRRRIVCFKGVESDQELLRTHLQKTGRFQDAQAFFLPKMRAACACAARQGKDYDYLPQMRGEILQKNLKEMIVFAKKFGIILNINSYLRRTIMAKITKDMTINEVLEKDVNTAPIFFESGMHCIGCPSAAGETLEEASLVHGLDVDVLVAKLNEYFGE